MVTGAALAVAWPEAARAFEGAGALEAAGAFELVPPYRAEKSFHRLGIFVV